MEKSHGSIIGRTIDLQDESRENPAPVLRSQKSYLRGRFSRAAVSRLFSTKSTLSVPSERVVSHQFRELFREPISDQHRQYFKKYFASDISTKTFTIEEFGRMFQVKFMLSRRLLMVFDLESAFENNQILGTDIIRIARALWTSPMSVKALILFKLFDSNNDNIITMEEIRLFYENYSSEFKIFKNDEHHKEVVDTFLQGIFPTTQHESQHEEINFNQFYRNLQQNPDVLKSLYLISIPDQDKEEEKEITWFQRCWMYIKNNINRLTFLAIYFLIQIILIIYVCIYRTIIIQNTSVWRVFARVGGMLINFNYFVAVTLMLKQIMTFIRKYHYLRLIIPVDDHIDGHRLVGTMLFISAMVHSLGHTIHFATHTEELSWPRAMFTTAAEIGWVGHSAPITGDILFVLLMIMFIFALQCIRQRSGFYFLFQYTHYLFWPIFILLVIHAPDFWKWAIGPMTLLFLEKIYSLKRYSSSYGRTRLRLIRFEYNNLLTLIIERPVRFNFRTGNYINICLPKIAKTEWHPFTISSSPERKDIIQLNIMKQKNWTKKVYDHFHKRLATELTDITFENGHQNMNSDIGEIRFSADDPEAIICIEGPFSTCTSYIFDHEHVVLIGAGIGVTPSISALDSLIQRLQKERCVCPNCDTISYNHERLNSQKLKKVDFIWINREVGNFSWFRNILNEFENEQENYLRTLSTTTTNPGQQSIIIQIS
ncbi:hypothetical protein I4U23_030925 [Adineta vaga]|nr:hypothetical protein I4U23_030925 [Adineta vaga]